MPKFKPIEDRFFSHLNKTNTCWLWTGPTNGKYGVIKRSRSRVQMYVHRLSWELHHGPIPEGLLICHHCDTPLCANPEHLFLGTHSDNHIDALHKGRHQSGKGRRTKYCIHGHERTPENTRLYYRDGVYIGRFCRDCKRERYKRESTKKQHAARLFPEIKEGPC